MAERSRILAETVEAARREVAATVGSVTAAVADAWQQQRDGPDAIVVAAVPVVARTAAVS